jgi:hypothetical protein
VLRQSVNLVPPNFTTLLEEELKKVSAHDTQKGGGFVMPVMTAEFEADALIKRAFQNKKFQLVMSNDVDYPADLGDSADIRFSIASFSGI